MRREGYELAISRPEVIMKEVKGKVCEPWQTLMVDIEDHHQGAVMEKLGERRGELRNIGSDGRGRTQLEYLIPTRGLIGFRSEFLTSTSGTGLMYHAFDHYGPKVGAALGRRNNGVLVSMATGKSLGIPCLICRSEVVFLCLPGLKFMKEWLLGYMPGQMIWL